MGCGFATIQMKMQMIDSFDEEKARELTGCRVIDESGELVGTMDGFWLDPSTHRLAFLGVKSSSLSGNVHVVPARDAQLAEQDNLVKLRYPTAFIKKGSNVFSRKRTRASQEEEVNAYFGRIASLRRASSIEEIRPEETINSQNSDEESGIQNKSEGSVEDRLNLERSDQAFFNQKGFVTDSMPEVDASPELLRTQKEAKVRNLEDRIKRGSLD